LSALNTHGMEEAARRLQHPMNKDAVFDHGAQLRAGDDARRAARLARHPGAARVINDTRMDEE
jgi:chromosome condensin MukBEF MukE localization factor